jgi:hypothetical protein
MAASNQTKRRAVVIDPNGIYTAVDFRETLGLTPSSLRREVRERRLRIAKRCGRYFLLGKWILSWIEEGEIRREK